VVVASHYHIVYLGGHNCPDQGLFGAVKKGDLEAVCFYLPEVAQILSSYTGELEGQACPVAVVIAVNQLYRNAQPLEDVAVA